MNEMVALEPEVARKPLREGIDNLVKMREELRAVLVSNYTSMALNNALIKIEEAEMWLFKALDIVERDLKEVQ